MNSVSNMEQDQDQDQDQCKKYSNRQRRKLVDTISTLSVTEHNEIFKLLESHHVKFTKNRNGVFLNFSAVPDNLIDTIYRFVEFCLENMTKLEAYDKRIIECKLHNNYDVFAGHSQDMDSAASSEELGKVLSKKKADKFNEVAGFTSLIQSVRSDQRVQSLLSQLQKQTETVHRKKHCTKFMAAKKRFAKRVAASAVDRRGDSTDMDDFFLLKEDVPCIQVQKN